VLLGCSEPEQPTINLYRAIHAGDLDQIKRHLFWETDINAPGVDGDYPLHVAARRGRVVIAGELLDHGADLRVRNGAGQTPLQVALIEGKTQLAEVLMRAGAGETPQDLLFMLARSGVSDRDSLDLVVKAGADVDKPNQIGATALHVAVSSGYLLVVKRLIALGADVNAPDRDGRTPLAIATADGRRDIIALLEPFGARLEATASPD
jgi:ankyrin repeat protein